jgi:hypothetical protein
MARSPPLTAASRRLAASWSRPLSRETCPKCHRLCSRVRYSKVYADRQKQGGRAMRVFLALAIIISAAIGMAGCFYHHEQAVVTQPAPPLK